MKDDYKNELGVTCCSTMLHFQPTYIGPSERIAIRMSFRLCAYCGPMVARILYAIICSLNLLRFKSFSSLQLSLVRNDATLACVFSEMHSNGKIWDGAEHSFLNP